MTRGEALKGFCIKNILPATVAMLLFCIFKSACTKDGVTNCMTMDTLRPALRTPLDVPLDHAGWTLLWW